MKLAIVLLSLLTFAPVTEASLLKGECGDHWFNVTFNIKESGSGTFTLGGDSGASGIYPSKVVKTAQTTTLQSPVMNAYLRIEKVANYHVGYFSPNGDEKSEVSLGTCY